MDMNNTIVNERGKEQDLRPIILNQKFNKLFLLIYRFFWNVTVYFCSFLYCEIFIFHSIKPYKTCAIYGMEHKLRIGIFRTRKRMKRMRSTAERMIWPRFGE